MIDSTLISNIEIFAFIALLVFKLLSHKGLLIIRKDNKSCLKVGYFFKKIGNFTGKLLQNFKYSETSQ